MNKDIRIYINTCKHIHTNTNTNVIKSIWTQTNVNVYPFHALKVTDFTSTFFQRNQPFETNNSNTPEEEQITDKDNT